MKKMLVILGLALLVLASSCYNNKGQLTGVPDRGDWYQSTPYGMLFVKAGTFEMGNSDEDVPYANISPSKRVTLQAFYMDETEITNNEYRQFVYWVRDSLALRLLADMYPDEYSIEENEYDELIDPPNLNWDEKIRWDDLEQREILEDMYYPEHERYYKRRQLDTRKFDYEFYWIDFREAAKKDFMNDRNPEESGLANRPQGLKDRSVYIRKDVLNVYPDTLCWIHDFTYSYQESMTKMYFWHPAYDHYPVVGVTWKQSKAFCNWRTLIMEQYNQKQGEDVIVVEDFRLPTEAEWEWAARGDAEMNPYPWGGPYIRNSNGCFLGNYKPLRGNYIDDGGIQTLIVGHYSPNDFGLYDMAGNVAEWCNDAFNPITYRFAHDLNPSYEYNALDQDPPEKKRKVIRGGSWKDIGYYMQVGTRTYEYQDSAKSYVGFRCVQTYAGRDESDGPNSSNIY